MISDAIVVRVVDYGEADRVATLLTRAAGKVSALARGARRSRRRYASLELFSRGEAKLKEGRGELWTFESFDVQRGYPHLPLDVARVAQGAYACELARELSPPHHPEPRVFDLLDGILSLLDAAENAPSAPPLLSIAWLRIFELGILDAVGLQPALDRCVECARPLDDQPGDEGGDQLDLRRGGVLCGRCVAGPGAGRRPLPARVRRLLSQLQRTTLAEAPSLLSAPFAAASGTWEAARDAIQAILRELLGRPLRSVEFIEKLNAVRA